MRKIRIFCVGKNQEPYIKSGMSVFEKKIRRYCDFGVEFIKPANYAVGRKETWLEKEAAGLSKHISPSSFTIVCDEKGKSFTSREFSKEFTRRANEGYSRFDFIIGGAYGLSEKLRKKARLKLSFSPMTMTHQLFRLVLMEQIYRAFTIANGEKYHH